MKFLFLKLPKITPIAYIIKGLRLVHDPSLPIPNIVTTYIAYPLDT